MGLHAGWFWPSCWSLRAFMNCSKALAGPSRPQQALADPCRMSPPCPPRPLQQGIQKLIRLLEGQPEAQFNAEQYMMLYT